MSFGGDFYSLSDDQLKSILDAGLDGEAFLGNQLKERPSECFSRGTRVWYELTKLLATENACGTEITDAIPEGGGYSYSPDVRITAEALRHLTTDDLRSRYAMLETELSFEEINSVVDELVQFYSRVANSGNAVIFNIR